MINVIDSDFDEDDEYNQYEIDEIFSISPTGEETFDIDPSKDEYGDSEFDQDDIITPGGGNISSIHGAPDDRDDEDCDDDNSSDLSDLRIKRQMLKLGMHMHGTNSKAYEEYFQKHNAQGKLLENLDSKVFKRLLSPTN